MLDQFLSNKIQEQGINFHEIVSLKLLVSTNCEPEKGHSNRPTL